MLVSHGKNCTWHCASKNLLLQAFKNGLQMHNMLLWCPAKDYHVINVIPSK